MTENTMMRDHSNHNKEILKSANPYMPLWEHVPDGEPHVFEYNGSQRVYVYGSHDTLRTEECSVYKNAGNE